jgi:hypothetical protein
MVASVFGGPRRPACKPAAACSKRGGSLSPREEFDRQTAFLGFTKDFHTALQAVMDDELGTCSQRVLAWLKRRSWGNYSLYCINDDGGPARAVDCCRELRLDKTRVSHCLKDYQRRGYLVIDARRMTPAICPERAKLEAKVADARNFSSFVEDHWKVADARNFCALEVARAEVERLRKVALVAYRQWRALQTDPAPSLSESVESSEREDERTVSAPPDDSATAAPLSVRLTQNQLREDLRGWLTDRARRFRLLIPLDAEALDLIAANIKDAGTLQRFCLQVEKQSPRPAGWKYFAPIAKACAAAGRAEQRRRPVNSEQAFAAGSAWVSGADLIAELEAEERRKA